MKRFQHRRGFTLMEVNLAIFIMAVAVLGMVALYPLGFRESQHARDDVTEAAVADGILNPLVAALCSSNISWTAWKNIIGSGNDARYPNNGWEDYCETGNDDYGTPKNKSSVNGTTRSVIQKIDSAYKGNGSPGSDAQAILNSSGMACALVISYGMLPTLDGTGGTIAGYHTDYSRIVLCLRVSRRAQRLFEQPAYYSEVRFQGGRY